MANLIETNQWEDGVYQIEKTDPVVGGKDGISNLQAQQLANRTSYLKNEVELRAAIDSPSFTGTPTAPTPSQTVSNTQVATTEFVKTAIANLVGSAPATLDTLAEIATALGNDGKIKEVLLAEIAKKANTTDFNNLKNLLVGIPFPYPLSAVPSGCLAFNGQTFNKTTYPILAQKYPSGVLPDLRAEFIRGWDNGRGVDAGRGLLGYQEDAIRNITANFDTDNGFIFTTFSGAFYDHRKSSTENYNKITTTALNPATQQPNIKRAGYFAFDASRVVPTANENRPRNIAFQYICLAA